MENGLDPDGKKSSTGNQFETDGNHREETGAPFMRTAFVDEPGQLSFREQIGEEIERWALLGANAYAYAYGQAVVVAEHQHEILAIWSFVLHTP
jgi:hypothetical protein